MQRSSILLIIFISLFVSLREVNASGSAPKTVQWQSDMGSASAPTAVQAPKAEPAPPRPQVEPPSSYPAGPSAKEKFVKGLRKTLEVMCYLSSVLNLLRDYIKF
uniref:Uncharacterized protein n=1 Tax=Trichobilharzia regenti TaxID=157069 RepID=A0AA85IUG2_TRIRE|nr:unnamed protein product [Trichobilharzia regenti]